jgi:probable HAF family extracellular repeat protein
MVSLGTNLANGVSGDGSVVVGGDAQAFQWTSGGMVNLGFLPGSSPPTMSSIAQGASYDGSVVIGSSTYSASGSNEAFRWTSSSGMVGLGFLPSGTASYGSAVSADGSVVVGSSSFDATGLQQAIRWTSGGGMVGLGFLPGTDHSDATAVSADGSVVVGNSSNSDISNPIQGSFRWTASGGMVSLGGPTAYGVSGDGSVVVGSCGGVGGACIWDAKNGWRVLRNVLTSDGLNLPAMSLDVATGVSADGETIVGYGTLSVGGKQEAWIAVLPEPTTGLLVMAGVLGLAVARRTRA